MIDTRPTGVTCPHLELIERTDGWGHCPQCGEFESGTVAKAAIGMLTEDEVRDRIEEEVIEGAGESERIGRDLGHDDGMESAFERVADATERLASDLDGLLYEAENDETINVPDEWLATITAVAKALEDRKWENG